jgi:hypothetical protein
MRIDTPMGKVYSTKNLHVSVIDGDAMTLD